jgi:hypothetical protein
VRRCLLLAAPNGNADLIERCPLLGVKAKDICSQLVFRLLTLSGHSDRVWRRLFAVYQLQLRRKMLALRTSIAWP